MRSTSSWPSKTCAVPKDEEDWGVIKMATILGPQYPSPRGKNLALPASNGSEVQPRLKTLKESLGQSSTPIASAVAKPVGLLAYTPPSIRGCPPQNGESGRRLGLLPWRALRQRSSSCNLVRTLGGGLSCKCTLRRYRDLATG